MSNHGFYGHSRLEPYETLKQAPEGIAELWVWFKADSLEDRGLKDGDRVTFWENSNPVRKGVTNYALHNCIPVINYGSPMYRVGQVNGWPVVRIAYNQTLSYSTPDTSLLPGTWVIVHNRTAPGATDAILYSTSFVFSYTQYADLWYVGNGLSQSIQMAADTFMLRMAMYDGANITRYTNGTAHTPQASAAATRHEFLGGHVYLECNVDVAELIVYGKVLNEYERKLLESYLNAKYALW